MKNFNLLSLGKIENPYYETGQFAEIRHSRGYKKDHEKKCRRKDHHMEDRRGVMCIGGRLSDGAGACRSPRSHKKHDEDSERKIAEKLRSRGWEGMRDRYLDISHLREDGTGSRFIEYSVDKARRKVPLGGPYPYVVSDSEEKRDLFTKLARHTEAERSAVRDSHRKRAKEMGIVLLIEEIVSPSRRVLSLRK